MIFSSIASIKEENGDYVVMAYYGSEGLVVMCQTKTLEEAIENQIGSGIGCTAILKLVRIELKEVSNG